MECLVCYKGKCDFKPNCMDLISVDMVIQAVKRQLHETVPAQALDGAGRGDTGCFEPIVPQPGGTSLPVI